MTVTEKRDQLVKNMGETYALFCIDEIREELLKQFNKLTPDATIGFWCNTEECKFWMQVKFEIDNEQPEEPEKPDRWEKNYIMLNGIH